MSGDWLLPIMTQTRTIDFPDSIGGSLGVGLFIISTLICSFEMVPGWGGLQLGLTAPTIFAAAILCGTVSGALVCDKHRLLGALCGAVCSAGSLSLVSLHLWVLPVTSGKLAAVMAGLGCLPGVGLYYSIARILDQPEPVPESRLASLDREVQRVRQ
jgi:hypothetical protein